MTFLEQLNQLERKCSKILQKIPTEVVLLNTKSSTIAAVFLKDDDYIAVNSVYNELSPSVVIFLAHESRHAYQWQVINGLLPAKESDDLDRWKYEFENHIKPASEINHPDDVKEYALQNIEIDAIAFSELFLQYAVRKSLKVSLPDYLRPIVNERKKIIEKELNFDESN